MKVLTSDPCCLGLEETLKVALLLYEAQRPSTLWSSNWSVSLGVSQRSKSGYSIVALGLAKYVVLSLVDACMYI